MNNNYTTIIGLEIHVELKTLSKMFCACKNDPFFAGKPNIYTCPVCLGLPGALPVPNRKAIDWTIKLGLALGCEIPLVSKFDRKHYFYPDLPKGYQISQYDMPFCKNGFLEVENTMNQTSYNRMVRIRRVHLEEDTGKLLHAVIEGKKRTLVDFNRSGVPLVEIVTEPDIRSGSEATAFLKKIHRIIRYLCISDADMEKGSMRIEPSISMCRKSDATSKSRPGLDYMIPAYRVEIKNINSFRFVRKAIDYEIKRQRELLYRGETPEQETRGWNEGKGITVSQRSKEEAADYRYFPEPDIPPLRWQQSTIKTIQSTIPELPDAKKKRFMETYDLSDYDAEILVETSQLADYFEECTRAAQKLMPDTGNQDIKQYQEINPKSLANWIINRKINFEEILPARLVTQIVQTKKTSSIDKGELEKIVAQVLVANSKAVEDYKKGKEQALMFLVGQGMRTSKGKISPESLKKLIADSIIRRKEKE
ncbi:Asp-tRNA(Asn)/Glu-tRNA(Gln) amidotransferase subunit GatB [Patescibacteria group bacterium]|nr:Asp-tRNA(Asn)/Glu-tRNA(Gln) amidotransferase subunit GatB [Patescibacteria group bacterium]